jgi:glycosyltransferase involved in cell wall biosynthesis
MRKKITVIIPCHNEEKGIGKVIDAIPVNRLFRLGYRTDIVVIDNNSTDKTREIALSRNAKVIHEAKKGKGHAIRAGLQAIHPLTDYVVMLDGDNTYKHEIHV